MTQPQPPARGIKLVSQVMVSAHFFIRARLAYALTRRRAHMMVNPGHWHRTLLVVSLVLALTLSIGYVIWGWLKPAGTISDNTKIVADRTTATIYVVLAGRLYPATNLTSARGRRSESSAHHRKSIPLSHHRFRSSTSATPLSGPDRSPP
jgi:hypothetical protein